MRTRITSLVVAALLAAFTFTPNLHAQALVNIETVTVGDAGNVADTTGYGAVAGVFAIGKYEVTISQYNAFLNSVAAVTSEDYLINLWSFTMGANTDIGGSISRSGSGTIADPFFYTPVGDGGRPVAFVSWFDAARFANWINNGATDGASTETGAYTLNGATSGVGFLRNPGATWFLPSEDEWYKAAYYEGGATNAGYWLYPTQSNEIPVATAMPPGGTNSANYASVRPAGPDRLAQVGAYVDSQGAYGTFDQGGNVWEWNEAVIGSSARGIRGAGWSDDGSGLASTGRFNDGGVADDQNAWIGFRVATVPEPSTYALLLMTGAGALWWSRRRR